MAIGAGNKPSKHGRILGEMLAAWVEAGRRATEELLPDICATCAFRAGSLPNQAAGTVLLAMNTVLDIDPDGFGCHHGMKDCRPTKLCTGYLIAKLAPFSEVKEEMVRMKEKLDALGDADADAAEHSFDQWLLAVDPDGLMDVYELASAFARRPPVDTDIAAPLGGDGARS